MSDETWQGGPGDRAGERPAGAGSGGAGPYGGGDPDAPGVSPVPGSGYDPYAPPGGSEVLDGERPRSRKGVVVGVAAAILVVVAGAGVYLTSKLSGGGVQPEALAPRSTFAFVKLDLDPPAGQKVAVRDFAGHFPSAPKGASDDILRRFVAEALGSGDVDYERDVEPWLGKRIGVAVFDAGGAEPAVVGLVQSTDDAAAKAGLDRIDQRNRDATDDFAYRLHRGYAVVSGDQETVDRAVAESDRESFETHERYEQDVDTLTGDQVLTAWLDLETMLRVMRKAVPELGSLPSGLLAQSGGRMVLGAHATSDYAEVEGYSIGSGAVEGLRNAAPALLTGLPEGTLAAASVNDLGAQVNRMYDQFATLGVDPRMVFGAFEAQTGLSVRDDIIPLFGKQTAVALGSMFADPTASRAGLLSEVGDTAKAAAVGRKLAALGQQLGVPLRSDVKGDTFYLAMGEGYLEDLQERGTLGATPAFRQAMGELGDDVAAAVFVDIGAIVDALPAGFVDQAEDLRALRSFGASAGRQGDRGYFRMRLVAR